MTIRLSAIPDHVPATAAATMLRVRGGLNDERLCTADDSVLHLSVPHGVYNLGAADLAAGRGLPAAQLTAWRHLVDDSGTPVATVEVGATDGSSSYLATAGPRAPGLAGALSRAETLEQTAGTDYDLRVLRIPALHAELLWLSAPDASRDLLIPIPPSTPPLDPDATYSPATLTPLLQTMAAAKDLSSTTETS